MREREAKNKAGMLLNLVAVAGLFLGGAGGISYELLKEENRKQETRIDRQLDFEQALPTPTYTPKEQPTQIPTKKPIKLKQKLEITGPEIEKLARIVYGEGRACNEEEQTAIAYTAINRLHRGNFGNTLDKVLNPNAYNCLGKFDFLHSINNFRTNFAETLDSKRWEKAYEVAKKVATKQVGDPTRGATHYFNPRTANPNWKNSMKEANQISGSKHEFYKE